MISHSFVDTLVRAGSNSEKHSCQVIDLLEPIKRYDFINRQAPDTWNAVTDVLPIDQHIALLKGIVLAERFFKWAGGSAAAGIWIFRSLVEKIDLVQQTHLTFWVLNHTRNDYLPTGFRSGNDSYLFLASADPKFIDENDLTWAYEKAQSHRAYEKARNDYYQEQLAVEKKQEREKTAREKADN